MYIVMTSAARMPNSCWGIYRNVAVVEIDQHMTARGQLPKMISRRAKGVLALYHMGRLNVGYTERCAYAKAVKEAETRCHTLNNASPTVDPAEMFTWGGSA